MADDTKTKAAANKNKRPPKLLAWVDEEGCTGCEACISFCPVDCIAVIPGPDPDNAAFAQTVRIVTEDCIGCKLCAQYCPWETIFMVKNPAAAATPKPAAAAAAQPAEAKTG